MGAHPTVTVEHPRKGWTLEVDEFIADLIAALWRNGVETSSWSCQDVGDGYAGLAFGTFADLRRFLELTVEPLDEDEADWLDEHAWDDDVYADLPYRWRAAGWLYGASHPHGDYHQRGEWRYSLNPYDESDTFDAIVTVEFPQGDVEAVSAALP